MIIVLGHEVRPVYDAHRYLQAGMLGYAWPSRNPTELPDWRDVRKPTADKAYFLDHLFFDLAYVLSHMPQLITCNTHSFR